MSEQKQGLLEQIKGLDAGSLLGLLDGLRDAVVGRLAGMDSNAKIRALENAQPKIKIGSPEHEALLESGYGMTRAKAEAIIEERKADPRSYPYELYEKAQAFTEALKTGPIVISKRKPWRTRASARA